MVSARSTQRVMMILVIILMVVVVDVVIISSWKGGRAAEKECGEPVSTMLLMEGYKMILILSAAPLTARYDGRHLHRM